MTERSTEPGQIAVDSAIEGIAGIERPVLEPGIRLALDYGNIALQVPTLPVTKPPDLAITKATFEKWLREAIQAWQGAANDALDRATDVLKTVEDINMSPALGSILDIAGALLGPIRPWASAVSTTLAIVLKDVASATPATLDPEAFRVKYIEVVDLVTDRFLDDVPKLVDELVEASEVLNWTKNEGQEKALLRVLDAPAVKKILGGLVAIDESRLRAQLELGLLLDFAGTGQKANLPSGGTIPYFIIIMKYIVILTHSDSNGERRLNNPDRWNYTFVSYRIQSVVPGLYPRIRSLLKLLNLPLSLSTRNVPLSVEFEVVGSGTFEYITRTSVWQPPSQFDLGGITQVSEGIAIEVQGSNDTLRVVEFGSLSSSARATLESYIATTARYQGLERVISFEQIVGLILMREAWGGPLPDLEL